MVALQDIQTTLPRSMHCQTRRRQDPSSFLPRQYDGRRVYGVRETTDSPAYYDVPRRRCGHLACGTYCSLSTTPLTDRGPLRRSIPPLESKMLDRPGVTFGGSRERHLCGGRCAAVFGGLTEEPEVRFKGARTEPEDLDTLGLQARDVPILRPQELLEKLREDPMYLMREVCKALQKLDRYSRGIVRATVLARILRCLGAHPPMPEISEVLRYCLLTKDGYVVYKPLIIRVFPERVPGYQDQVRDHLSPPEVWDKDIYPPACPTLPWHPFRSPFLPQPKEAPDVNGLPGPVAEQLDAAARTTTEVDWLKEKTPPWKFDVTRDPLSNPQLTPAKSDAIRRIFAMWDRCLIDDDALKLHLKCLGLPMTRDAEQLIATHSATRDVPFGKFLHAFQMDDLTSGRRNRTVAPYLAGWLDMPPPSRFSARRLFEAKDEPVSWRCRYHEPVERTETGIGSLRWTSDRHRVPEVPIGTTVCPVEKEPEDEESLRRRQLSQLLADVADHKIHPLVLRGYLDRLGVPITPELDTVLREQEAAGSVPYRKLMTRLGVPSMKACAACVAAAGTQ